MKTPILETIFTEYTDLSQLFYTLDRTLDGVVWLYNDKSSSVTAGLCVVWDDEGREYIDINHTVIYLDQLETL